MEIPIDFVIRSSGTTDPEMLRSYAERRLTFALRRFENRVRHLTMRLEDINGPRRGVDCRCSVLLQLRSGRYLEVGAITAWPFASMTLAAKRLNAALRRELEKAQQPVRRDRVSRSALP